MAATKEIVTLLSAQPMVAIGLLTMTHGEYELLMLRVRAALMRAHADYVDTGPPRHNTSS